MKAFLKIIKICIFFTYFSTQLLTTFFASRESIKKKYPAVVRFCSVEAAAHSKLFNQFLAEDKMYSTVQQVIDTILNTLLPQIKKFQPSLYKAFVADPANPVFQQFIELEGSSELAAFTNEHNLQKLYNIEFEIRSFMLFFVLSIFPFVKVHTFLSHSSHKPVTS